MKRHSSLCTAGLTTVEMMVAVAIIAIVSVTVSLVFKNSISHAAYNYQVTAAVSEKIRAVQVFRSDFVSSPSSTMGSLLTNGDFEQGTTGWPTSASGSGTVDFIDDVSSATVHAGLASLELTSSDGTQVYVQSNHMLTLSAGCVYYLTGFIRSGGGGSTGGISLLDENNQIVVTTSTTNTAWTRVWSRYPASGVYETGDVPIDKLHLRVFATGGTSSIYADNIGFSPSEAILADSVLDANVPTSPSGGLEDPTGFRFQINGENGPVVYRYRVVDENDELRLLRENFNEAAGGWVSSGPSVIARGFSSLRFTMPDPALYATRSSLPATISMGFPQAGYGKTEETVDNWSFSSLVP